MESNGQKVSFKAQNMSARLYAVQAIYQMAIANEKPENIVNEFIKFRFGKSLDGEHLVAPNEAMFRMIFKGASTKIAQIDEVLNTAWKSKSHYANVENLLKAILRAGVFEILENSEVPVGIIINDYLNIVEAFYAGNEKSLVNATLDSIAKQFRK